jgi:hypothetical protein
VINIGNFKLLKIIFSLLHPFTAIHSDNVQMAWNFPIISWQAVGDALLFAVLMAAMRVTASWRSTPLNYAFFEWYPENLINFQNASAPSNKNNVVNIPIWVIRPSENRLDRSQVMKEKLQTKVLELHLLIIVPRSFSTSRYCAAISPAWFPMSELFVSLRAFDSSFIILLFLRMFLWSICFKRSRAEVINLSSQFCPPKSGSVYFDNDSEISIANFWKGNMESSNTKVRHQSIE